MFIATLFKITELLKQPECTSAGEWIDKLCDMSLLWSNEKNTFFLFAITFIILKCIMVSGRSQAQRLYILCLNLYNVQERAKKNSTFIEKQLMYITV